MILIVVLHKKQGESGWVQTWLIKDKITTDPHLEAQPHILTTV